MTLKIRIEKVDATDFIAKVRAEYKNAETGEWGVPEPEIGIVFGDKHISWPAESCEFTIWSGKRLVIEEDGSNGLVYISRDEFYRWQNRAIESEKRVKELEDSIIGGADV